MIRPAHPPDLESARSEAVYLLGMSTLHMRIRDCRVCVDSGEVRNLVVPDLLGIILIDQFVKSIFQGERKVVPYCSKPVQLLMLMMQTFEDKQLDNQQENLVLFMVLDRMESKKVQEVQQIMLQPMSLFVLSESTHASGLVQISSPAPFQKSITGRLQMK